jgi:hypothetical protein
MRTYTTVGILCAVLCSTVWAEQRPRFLGGDAKMRKFAAGDVALSYPDDWRQIPVPAPTIAAFSKGDDASVGITRAFVEFPPSINEAFVEYENQSMRRDHPAATEFASATVTHRTLGEILQIEFTETRAVGRNKRVFRHRFLAIPAGNYVYRVMFAARADEFAKKYGPLIDQVIDSLVITPPPPPKAGA